MSQYRNYDQDQVEELLSNYLIDSWSFSKLSTFARNEKEFEMRYLYNQFGKISSTSVGGQAYHKALELYFLRLKEGESTDIVDLQQEAFQHISDVSANMWKISKTRPTVQDCINHALESANKGINNFLAEVNTYLSEIKEVLEVELRLKSWMTINGVDIPLPCNLVIDLVCLTNDNKRVIIDHKLRTSFTDESDIKFTIGKQAITYTKGYESEVDETIDEVWIIENKLSKNRDASPQLALYKTTMDDSTRRLYEAILYEPLRRMILAVGDVDYVYLINDSDNFTDKAEIYEFWAKTMIAEIEEFNVSDNKKAKIKQRLKKIRDASLATITPTVVKNFEKYAQEFIAFDLSNKDMTDQEKIEHVLRMFSIITKVQHTFNGYSSSSYLLGINAGTPISNINKYRLDIANALDVPNVRIQKDLVVYEGKSYLSIESVKKSTETLLWDKSKLKGHKIPLGIDNFQQTIVWDLDNHSTPHMLICGSTGSGKSVSIKSTIEYVLAAGIHELYIFDPKFEFTSYKSNPRITVVNDIEDIESQMQKLIVEMERRVKVGVSTKTIVIFDEYADALANSRKGNALKRYESIEVGTYKNGEPKMQRQCVGEDRPLSENLQVLLQKGRSSGFRVIAATQRASTQVITGDTKVNFPVQVCFRVPKDTDSMVVIDEPGAESLNGRGDGLIKSPEYLGVVRFQAFYKD